MGKKLISVLIMVPLAFFVTCARQCNTCDFDKRFEHVHPTCNVRSNADDSASSKSVTTTAEEEMMISTTTDVTSRGITRGIDCVQVIGNEKFEIKNGSSTFDVNCTRYTCINGETKTDRKYNCSPNAVCEMRNEVHKCYCINGYEGDGEICTKIYPNCMDAFSDGHTESGVYKITLSNWNGPPFDVFCDMSLGGGWTVVQRRVNGSVNFHRNWSSYKEGFGEVDHEFWLGNNKLNYFLQQDDYDLRIDLKNVYGKTFFAAYSGFKIKDESEDYRLVALGHFFGTAGFDALSQNVNYKFSTFDRDNDDSVKRACAVDLHGGWWYKNCSLSNLNGDYPAPNDRNETAIYWHDLPGNKYDIKYTQMRIRPKQ